MTKNSSRGTGTQAGRQRMLLLVVAAAALLSVGGLLGATFIKSPEQVAADQRPPEPSVLTAEVTRQIVRSTLLIRGEVTGSTELQVTPVRAVSGETGAGSALVTATRTRVGAQVRAGDVLVEVSGRPLIALRGDKPSYRDIKPGEEGPHVTALQSALAEVGLPCGDRRGWFGPGTKNAVKRLYQRLGYEPPVSASATGDTGLRAAQDTVEQAKRRLRDAKEGGASIPTDGTPNPGNSAKPPGTGNGHAVADAQADLKTAESRLAEIKERLGPMVPSAEVVFVPDFPAKVLKSAAVVGQEVKAPLITLSAGALRVIGKADPVDRSALRVQAEVEINGEDGRPPISGTVTSIGDPMAESGSGTAGQGPQSAAPEYVAVTVEPKSPLDAALLGRNVRLSLRLASTDGEVLAVPQAAVTTRADGATVVTVLDKSTGARRTVPVRCGQSGDGAVEVTPVDKDSLSQGMTVVTGQ